MKNWRPAAYSGRTRSPQIERSALWEKVAGWLRRGNRPLTEFSGGKLEVIERNVNGVVEIFPQREYCGRFVHIANRANSYP